jgi:hypothetical protein
MPHHLLRHKATLRIDGSLGRDERVNNLPSPLIGVPEKTGAMHWINPSGR